MSRIAFVSEELSVGGRTGEIGAAIYELSSLLAMHGHKVHIYYIPTSPVWTKNYESVKQYFGSKNVVLEIVNSYKYVHDMGSAEGRAVAVYFALKDAEPTFDHIHFHDYKGLGYFCASAKSQGVAFNSSIITVQLHGPTRWAVEANQSLFSHPDQLMIDFLERETIALADAVVSPSEYLVHWLRSHSFKLPDEGRVHIIKNAFRSLIDDEQVCSPIDDEVCSLIGEEQVSSVSGQDRQLSLRAIDGLTGNVRHVISATSRPSKPIDEKKVINVGDIIFFGRHEQRKGLDIFCLSLEKIHDILCSKRITVWFIGPLGHVNGQPSGLYLTERGKKWRFQVEFRIGFDRAQVTQFLRASDNGLVVIPSKEENSPYAVVEALAAGRPVVTSSAGGAKELIHLADHCEAIVDMDPDALAERLRMLT